MARNDHGTKSSNGGHSKGPAGSVKMPKGKNC